jgi:4'-phosphopantetheinyl transferase
MSDTAWQTPAQPFALPLDCVHVWRAELACSPNTLQMYAASLSPDEQERATRFRFSKDRDHYISARGILRRLLAGYLPAEPSAINFTVNAFGKPALDASFASSLEFNLSHSGGWALFAFAWDRRVGVDIELCRSEVNFAALADSVFSSKERQFLRLMPAAYRAPAFYACWTRKEAYIKAQGQGMSLALDSFDVSLTPGQPALLATRPDPNESRRWTMYDLYPAEGCAAALVVEGSRASLSLCTFLHASDSAMVQ